MSPGASDRLARLGIVAASFADEVLDGVVYCIIRRFRK